MSRSCGHTQMMPYACFLATVIADNRHCGVVWSLMDGRAVATLLELSCLQRITLVQWLCKSVRVLLPTARWVHVY